MMNADILDTLLQYTQRSALVKLSRLFAIHQYNRIYSAKCCTDRRLIIGPYSITYNSVSKNGEILFDIDIYYGNIDTIRIYHFPYYRLSVEYNVTENIIGEISRKYSDNTIIYGSNYRIIRSIYFYMTIYDNCDIYSIIVYPHNITISPYGISGLNPIRNIRKNGIIINNNKLTIFYSDGSKAAKLEYYNIHANRLKRATLYHPSGDIIRDIKK